MTVRNIASICNMVSAGGGRAAEQPLRGPAGGAAPGAPPRPLPGGGGAGQTAPAAAWDGVRRPRVTMSRGVFLEQPGRGPGRDGDAEPVRGPPERV